MQKSQRTFFVFFFAFGEHLDHLSESRQTPALISCKTKGAFKFVLGPGAIIAMNNDTIYTIDSPGKLHRLLEEEGVKGRVIVSQVHRCSSYARFLATEDGATVALGLSVAVPVSNPVAVDAKWVRNSGVGNFKTKVNSNGQRDFYPLFKLVSLAEGDITTLLRSRPDGDEERPLPDAQL